MLNKLQKLLKKFLNINDYTSGIDQFLGKLERDKHHFSSSQRAEKEKYDRVFKLRDQSTATDTKPSMWEQF